MKAIAQEAINRIVELSLPESLSLKERPPVPDDHVAHLFSLVQWGQTTLASDHLLFPEINGRLSETVGGLIRKLNLLFSLSRPVLHEPNESLERKILLRQYSYEVMLEMALNFYGLESRWLDEKEKADSLGYILNALEEWEDREREEGGGSIAEAVISKWLSKMKRVQKGSSMIAKTALRIEEGMDFKKNLFAQFLKRAEREIRENIYYRMVKDGLCKFGNDYAIGLRWLRHLGFEQVSTNPVLAARAYQDEPSLTALFRDGVKRHPDFKRWSAKPSQYGEEITLYATLLALWDNLYVFRPIFFNLRETSGGGVVSFQLNPNIAHLIEESIRDVFTASSLASENLSLYDQYLLAGYRMDGWKGRPNLVIKVAATTPAARTITRTINFFGFGSNITVDFSVSQEATLLIEEMEGMAGAMRKGIRPTQLYMTNMGGRLESHLREIKLEELFKELKKKLGEGKALKRIHQLSEANGTKDRVSQAKSYEEKVWAVTRYAHGQRTINEFIHEALKGVISRETLRNWEEAIGASGTLVARRVWFLFFSEVNRERWIAYLMKRKGLTKDQACLIMDRIHCLPASKRKPFDTYWTLSSRNLVHTEFPDHQENVRKMAQEPRFDLNEYGESISNIFPAGVLDQLNQIEDFRKAYEINPELSEILKEVGISGDFGLGGLAPSDWPGFGPVQKTLSEFKGAYDAFQKEMVSLIKKARSIRKKT
ncbi:MAG: hypothetical protein QME83_11315 [Thermodesulfobacteriota bacterium]|nr:hypothetical protein [Thermodesulfobacteriota bacterium]